MIEPSPETSFDVVIVGAGPAGFGTALALGHMGVTSMALLERHEVGASFDRWPAEMQFLTPSFHSNQFGWLDLNSFGLRISPAMSIGTEHPTGRQYAKFLRDFAAFFELPVKAGVDVRGVDPEPGGGFRLATSRGDYRAKFVVWAAGEFQYPRDNAFVGADLCLHNSRVRSWHELTGDEFVIVGGYESGIDAAVHLARLKKKVRVLDRGGRWLAEQEDPSVSLSPFTRDRLAAALSTGRVELIPNAPVVEVEQTRNGYVVRTVDGGTFITAARPILATGFVGSLRLIADRFEWKGERVLLSEVDESTITPGLFLVGPQVWHDEVIFCFVYKFRQRFAVVADAVARRLGLDTAAGVAAYRQRGMFLDDLSCCKEACQSC